jgi:hypothetical protein
MNGDLEQDGGRWRLRSPGTAPWPMGERWSAAHPGYVAKFGPEAATLGPPERHGTGGGPGAS